MKKLTAGIFAGLLTMVAVAPADAFIASKEYADTKVKINQGIANKNGAMITDEKGQVRVLPEGKKGQILKVNEDKEPVWADPYSTTDLLNDVKAVDPGYQVLTRVKDGENWAYKWETIIDRSDAGENILSDHTYDIGLTATNLGTGTEKATVTLKGSDNQADLSNYDLSSSDIPAVPTVPAVPAI